MLSFNHCPTINTPPLQAKTVKLAKQLASINFLREVVGTRRQLDLEHLTQEAGGASASAALAAAVKLGSGDRADGKAGSNKQVARLALDNGESFLFFIVCTFNDLRRTAGRCCNYCCCCCCCSRMKWYPFVFQVNT